MAKICGPFRNSGIEQLISGKPSNKHRAPLNFQQGNNNITDTFKISPIIQYPHLIKNVEIIRSYQPHTKQSPMFEKWFFSLIVKKFVMDVQSSSSTQGKCY